MDRGNAIAPRSISRIATVDDCANPEQDRDDKLLKPLEIKSLHEIINSIAQFESLWFLAYARQAITRGVPAP